MSSSISSSDRLTAGRDRTAKRALALVALVMLMLELSARLLGSRVSQDLATLEGLPARAARLAASPGPRVLMLGNSYTHQGFRRSAFDAAWLEQRRPPLSLEVMALDGAHIVEWLRWFQQDFAGRGYAPDLLVLNGHDSLRDQSELYTWRLASHVDARYLPESLSEDVTGFETRAQFLQEWLSASFASRYRLRLAVMDVAVPSYRAVRREIHQVLEGSRPTSPPTFEHLDRLLELARRAGTRVVVVAMPARAPTSIPAALSSRLERAGATLIDLRTIPGLSAETFTDRTHLNEAGAAVFTPALAKALAEDPG